MIYLIWVFFIFSSQKALAQGPTELTVEDAAAPGADAKAKDKTEKTTDKKKTETPSIFDEEEGMLVKKLTTPFEYDRQSKRDPFRLPEVSAIEIPLGGYFGPFLELQEVSLNDFKIKALILN